METSRCVPEEVPSRIPADRGTGLETDFEPGTKYCVTRQWQLPKEQVKYIDELFYKRAKSGLVRESKSPHCSPTFYERKTAGEWRVIHAYNKLNTATIPAQTLIPRKDVLLNSMGKSTIFSAMDLKDGYYCRPKRYVDPNEVTYPHPSKETDGDADCDLSVIWVRGTEKVKDNQPTDCTHREQDSESEGYHASNADPSALFSQRGPSKSSDVHNPDEPSLEHHKDPSQSHDFILEFHNTSFSSA